MLFAGFLWMLLPHAAHEAVVGHDDETKHITDVFLGAAVVVAGILLMVWSSKGRSESVTATKYAKVDASDASQQKSQ